MLFIILILIIGINDVYSQDNLIDDMIEKSISEQDFDEETQELLNELKELWVIDDNIKTVEQWKRIIKITVILLSKGYNELDELIEKLLEEVEKYKTLNDELDSLIEDLKVLKIELVEQDNYLIGLIGTYENMINELSGFNRNAVYIEPVLQFNSNFNIGLGYSYYVNNWFMLGGEIYLINIYSLNQDNFSIGLGLTIGFRF